jgi:aspartate ammonia-lyase
VNLGATAIGTGVNAHPEFGVRTCRKLSVLSGLPVIPAENLPEATQDAGAYVLLSGILKRVAVKLSKICNDLRLLSSGPRAGFGEINLPPVQPGSSIMPGKVNPVIPEVVNQTAFAVIGGDLTVTLAAEAGQLQLNAMLPIAFWTLAQSLRHLLRVVLLLEERCVAGITANRESMAENVERCLSLATVFVPRIGYAKASDLAREALQKNGNLRDVALASGLLSDKEVDELLAPGSWNLGTPHKQPA